MINIRIIPILFVSLGMAILITIVDPEGEEFKIPPATSKKFNLEEGDTLPDNIRQQVLDHSLIELGKLLENQKCHTCGAPLTNMCWNCKGDDYSIT